ncbi:hypothetical protein [Bacillus sp. THAF10]|nr:hypothetical protein [Bacillus sp. THAF10]
MAVKLVCGSCYGIGKKKLGVLPFYKKCGKCNGQGRLTRGLPLS